MVDLRTAPVGTPHRTAICCWCHTPLVVGQVLQLRCWLCPVDWRRQVKHALIVKAGNKDHARILGVTTNTKVCLDVPLPSQAAIEERIEAFRLQYPGKRLNLTWGGQAGPGKSHGIRHLLYRRSLKTPKHESLLLRENWEQLEKTHIRKMKDELPKLGARLVDRTAIFDNGAYIDCGHMADQEAIGRYLSTGYGIIAPDEATLYPVDAEGTPVLAELSTRARESWPMIENGGDSVPLFVPVTNPGGPTAFWLLDMCIDHTPDFERFPALAGVNVDGTPVYNPDHWQYQVARLDDNPYMREDYATTDLATLSKTRYEQLRHGDWHVFAGQFFSKWNEHAHVLDLDIPGGVTWFTSMDWGSNKPGCVLWWVILSDGRLYLRSELKFQGEDVSEVAKKMKAREKALGIPRVFRRMADPAMWIKDGKTKGTRLIGESIAETFQKNGVFLTQANNDRVNGWARCLQLLREAPDGRPWFQAHSDCKYFIRTIAAAKSDKANADDVDTNCDDHALDAWRYGAMSRPMPTSFAQTPTVVEGSFGWYKSLGQKPRGPLAPRESRVA